MSETQNNENTASEVVATPLPLRGEPLNQRVILVADQHALDAAVAELATCDGAFALDAERASGFKYSSRAYLVQVQRGESAIYLIDAPAIAGDGELEPFSGLAQLLATDVWILHAATQDLGCLAALGLKPSELFDTELGGRLAGFPRVGLGSMTESLLGFRLAKEHSAVDWSQRPMHADWLNYAALDVDVLHELHAAVGNALTEAGKAEFARQEFEHLVDFAPKPPKIDRWRGMTGLHEVKDQQKLAVARSIWQARENLAAKMDVSPGRLVPDSSIMAVTRETPRSRSELAGRKDFSGRASRTYLDTWWRAIEDGLQARDLPPVRVPATGIPNHRNWANKFPDADARLVALKPVVEARREALNMPVENVLTPDLMRQLAWEPPADRSPNGISAFLLSLGARVWQVQQVAAGFSAAITELP